MIEHSDEASVSATRSKRCLKAVDFLVNDVLMVLFSLSDIALDILVCRKFYVDGQMGFFYASMSIFLFAQCCYSFLFTLHWGKGFTSPQKIWVFFLVLPFGQFIPFLAWIESFGFPCFDKALKYLNLHTKNWENDEYVTRQYEEAGGDMLYDYIQKKFYSHGGFIVEALAEAIPQSILQTIAVLYFGEASILFIVSIFVSICVISSKGYLISYSMHRPTFVFNLICIFADVLCMFATVCWLFDHNDSSDDEGSRDPLFDANDGVRLAWVLLFGSACSLLVLSSGCLILFSTLDKHHQIDMGNHYDSYDTTLILFLELYFGPLLAWFFALVPLTVSLMTFKFILFPLSIQNEDQCNDFAKYQAFYSALHKFVSTHKGDLKLHITNRFILHCKGNQHRLAEALKGKHNPVVKKQVLREWLQTIGVNNHDNTVRSQLNIQAADLYQALTDADPNASRNSVRQYNTQKERVVFWSDKTMKQSLSDEYKVFDTFFNNTTIDVGGCCSAFLKYLRYGLALFIAAIGAPCVVLFIPIALCFLVYSWVYPLLELVRALVWSNGDLVSISTLPLCLTLAYLFTVVLMLCLAPAIHNFNRMCTDIVPLRGSNLPSIFFDVMVVKRIENVYQAELTWQHLDTVFDHIFGMDVTLIIKSYCDKNSLNTEGLYGLRNMNRLSIAHLEESPNQVNTEEEPKSNARFSDANIIV